MPRFLHANRIGAWPLALMGLFGFVSGLPMPLSGFTLRQWMTEGGASIVLIGYTASIGLPYSLKFLWSPWLDQVRPPLGLSRFGQRRGWLLLLQPLLALACVLLAWTDPAINPMLTMAAAAAVAFFSATQDIGIDAWRIGFFSARAQGSALAAYVWGYRLALLVSRSYVLQAVQYVGWRRTLLGVAALVAMGGVAATLLASEPPAAERVNAAPVRAVRSRLAAAVAVPLRDLLNRPAGPAILAFVVLFKLGEVLAGAMAPSFYHDLGFDRVQVAMAMRWPNLIANLLGVSAGGLLVGRMGAGRALVLTGFAQTASMAMYFALAVSKGDVHILYAKIVIEAFAEAMADAAFLSYLSSLCTPALAATQYALLSSLAAVGMRVLGNWSGVLALRLGWIQFFGVSMFAALPAMCLMIWLLRRFPAPVGAPMPD